MEHFRIAAWTIGAYLVGGIPFGLLLGKLWLGVDIREHGSRNLGATNASRVLGQGGKGATVLWFLAVFVLDALKGFGPAFFANRIEIREYDLPAGLFAALGAAAGHMASPYIRFRGGKGVAVSAGGLAALFPLPVAIAAGVWVLAVALTRYVSLGSILAAVAFLAAVSAMYYDPVLVAVFTALTGFVIFRHRGNIRRLMRGTENRVGGGGSCIEAAVAPPARSEPAALERGKGGGGEGGKGGRGGENVQSSASNVHQPPGA
jgi:glycerol-3-phosphate acyltransferase PlsY